MTERLSNILRGAGSILDIFPASHDRPERIHSFSSDEEALRHDWEQVGRDLWKAVEQEAARGRTPDRD